MHVRFTAPFDYTPSGDRRVTLAYSTGWEGLVKQECGLVAVALGVADEVPAPPRLIDPLDHDGDGRKGGSRARKAKA